MVSSKMIILIFIGAMGALNSTDFFIDLEKSNSSQNPLDRFVFMTKNLKISLKHWISYARGFCCLAANARVRCTSACANKDCASQCTVRFSDNIFPNIFPLCICLDQPRACPNRLQIYFTCILLFFRWGAESSTLCAPPTCAPLWRAQPAPQQQQQQQQQQQLQQPQRPQAAWQAGSCVRTPRPPWACAAPAWPAPPSRPPVDTALIHHPDRRGGLFIQA